MKTLLKLFLLGTFIFTIACEQLVDGDGNLNIDPDNATETGYQSVLTTAGVGQIIFQNGETSRLAGIFGGTHAGIARQYAGYNDYSITTGDFDRIWDDLFIHSFRNAKLAEELAAEASLEGITKGITQVHQALALGNGTALYGAIPFDDLATIEVQNPTFEEQLSVYEKIQVLLDEAINNLESGGDRPAAGADFFFEGSEVPWIEVAYTLKARFYLHTKAYDQALVAAENGISSLENNLMAPYTSAIEASNLNWQLWENETQGDDIILSDFFVSLIAADSASSPNFANYRGTSKTNEAGRFNYLIRTGDNGFQPNTNENFFAGQATASPIVTYQENLLILAETAFRANGFAAGLAQLNVFRAFMDNGGYLSSEIDTAAIQYDNYTAADFQSGGMENTDGVSADDALLREILQERYITLFSQIEIFNDVRRTQNETIVRVPVIANDGSQIPQRFIYAQSEIDRNENIPRPLPNLFDLTQVNQ